MKTIARVLVSAALMLAATGVAQASDETRFGALIRKHAPAHLGLFDSFSPKTLCVCDPSGARIAGVMTSIGTVVGCMIPVFVNGSIDAFQPCASFVVVGK